MLVKFWLKKFSEVIGFAFPTQSNNRILMSVDQAMKLGFNIGLFFLIFLNNFTKVKIIRSYPRFQLSELVDFSLLVQRFGHSPNKTPTKISSKDFSYFSHLFFIFFKVGPDGMFENHQTLISLRSKVADLEVSSAYSIFF